MSYLTVLQPDAVRPEPLYVTTSAAVTFGAGFHAEEHDGTRAFRWMGEDACLALVPSPHPQQLELWAFSEFFDLSQQLEVTAGDAHETWPLPHGWSPLSLDVPAGCDAIRLHATRIFPLEYYPGDTRRLAVRVREPRLHADAVRHAAVRRQAANAVRNAREMVERRVVLDSTPPSLGIDLHGACNVKPPCVYCEWDYNKALEGDQVSAPFTRDTLREMGPFYANAVSLVNCSIGEPFMMRQIDELLDAFGHDGKLLEMTTNGQILTDRNIGRLVGRPILLYVSLDAATPATYAKLRNDTFEKILHNLRRLIAAKGGPGGLPHLHLVFMPMRCNVHELEAFVRLCADLRVDRLVLRPLNASDATTLVWDRGGHHFDYQRELLPFEEVVRVSGRAASLARELGVSLSDQMDFGGRMEEMFEDGFEQGAAEVPHSASMSAAAPTVAEPLATTPEVVVHAARESGPASPASEPARPVLLPMALPSLGGEHVPACTEPWKSLYILRRGVMPCCYGGHPIAPMDEYREAWNGPLLQAIRGDLAAGKFHPYCVASPACPIVLKLEQSRALPLRQRLLLLLRRVWTRADRRLGGVPVRVWKVIRRAGHMTGVLAKNPARAWRRANEITRGNGPA